MPELAVTDLRVSIPTPEGVVDAVRGLSFTLERGVTLALVGESGAGKSVAAHALLGLVGNARVRGRAEFDGRNLLLLRDRDLRAIRGAQIAMIFQNPHTSLHPAFRIGWQIAESLRIHRRDSRKAARARAVELLSLVGIPDAPRRVDAFPHEFSGGMLQRAMIAMAIALEPRVLIADEPTTALDVTVQAQILALLERIQAELGVAVLFITHDLGVVARVASNVVVMYGGLAMETAPTAELFANPRHPYTRGLLASLPAPGATARTTRMTPIHGSPPPALRRTLPAGCPFHPRCLHATARCGETQSLSRVGTNALHQAACWFATEDAS